jgi:hypothetical protein
MLAVAFSIASSAVLSEPSPVVVPLATTPLTVDVTMSVVSRSVTVSVPLLVRVVFVSVNADAALSPLSMDTTGASLTPSMVIVI